MNVEDCRQAIITTLEALTPSSARTHRDRYRYQRPGDKTFGARSFAVMLAKGAQPVPGHAHGPSANSSIVMLVVWHVEIYYGDGDDALWGADQIQIPAALNGIPANVGATAYSHKIRRSDPESLGESPTIAEGGESAKAYKALGWFVEMVFDAEA